LAFWNQSVNLSFIHGGVSSERPDVKIRESQPMETVMRKVSQTRFAKNPAKDDRDAVSAAQSDSRPRGVAGATITSWHGSAQVDLTALFAGRNEGGSVSGAAGTGEQRPAEAAVALSDGTEITFATPADFTEVISV
jgi:hypothetical protein